MVGVSAMVDDSTIEPKTCFLITKVMDVSTLSTKILDVCAIFISVNVDDQNDKEVLEIGNVTVSLFKEGHPDDSETGDMIGLSSEDEAEDLSENEYIGRKYHVQKELPAPPPVPPTNPEPPVPPVPPPQSQPQVPVTSIQVPISMLQGVHQALGQLLQGQNPQFSLGQQQSCT